MPDEAVTKRRPPAGIGRLWPNLAARLAERPDSEHEQALVRIAIVAALALYFGTLALVQPGAALSLPAVIAFGSGYLGLAVGYFAWIVARPAPSRSRRLLGMITDQTCVSVLVASGGSWSGVLYPIYLWITFGNGFRYGNAYLAASAGYSLLAFLIAAQFNPFWQANVALTLGLALGLIVLPGYVASLIRKLTEAKRHAEAANHAKSRFLATMSHELRTPLNAVIGLSDLLAATGLDRKQADMVGTINTSGRALLGLINDVLDLAKIEAGKSDVRPVDFDLVAEVANSAAIVRPQAARKGFGLALIVDAGVPMHARGDARHLRQVLLNLLSNAVKFTDQGGVVLYVDARPRTDGHWLRIQVEDTGIGIDEADRKRIFEAFTQSDEDVNRRHSGTGLGLAIARELTEAMGGTLTVHSAPDQGSTFVLEIPLAPVRTISDIAPAPPAVRLATPAGRDAGDLTAALGAAGVAVQDTATHLCIDMRDRTTTVGADIRWPDWLAARAARASGCILVTDSRARVQHTDALALGAAVRVAAPVTDVELRTAVALSGALKPPATESGSLAREVSTDSRRTPATVLVVEDNPVNRKVTAKILEHAGHTPVVVDSGEKALDRLEAGGVDAVLMDVNMPGDSGLDTTKLFRMTELGAEKRLPIIALTADATLTTRDACLDAGMDDVITKPVDSVNLLRTLDRHLPSPAGVAEESAPVAGGCASLAEAASVPPIDLEAVNTLLELDPTGAFLAEVVDEFATDTSGLFDSIEEALAANDELRAQDLLHALKSAAGNVGAARLRARTIAFAEQLPAGGTQGARASVALLREDAEAYHTAVAASRPTAGRGPHARENGFAASVPAAEGEPQGVG